MRSSTFSFSGVEFERMGDMNGWNDWTSQGAFDQQVRLTRFGESRDGAGRKRKRLEIRRNPAADSFLKGRRRVEGNCWKINSLHGMIRLPRMEEQSKSDQIGQNKFTVLAGSCRRRLDELTPEKFIEQPWIKFPSWSHLTQASSDSQLIHLLTESRGMCSWKHPHGHYVAHVHYFVYLKKKGQQ